ncbi:hypothetical protein NMY22_g10521 [Coprinellus aureogranulatus]|nr:hypothetical protein NMY22_g10521 [Coprinellus aureogranulatus]
MATEQTRRKPFSRSICRLRTPNLIKSLSSHSKLPPAAQSNLSSTMWRPPRLPNTTVPEDDLADRVTEKRSAGLSVEEGPVSKKNGADEGGERYNWQPLPKSVSPVPIVAQDVPTKIMKKQSEEEKDTFRHHNMLTRDKTRDWILRMLLSSKKRSKIKKRLHPVVPSSRIHPRTVLRLFPRHRLSQIAIAHCDGIYDVPLFALLKFMDLEIKSPSTYAADYALVSALESLLFTHDSNALRLPRSSGCNVFAVASQP